MGSERERTESDPEKLMCSNHIRPLLRTREREVKHLEEAPVAARGGLVRLRWSLTPREPRGA